MIVPDIAALPAAEARAIIINVGTDLVSSVAVLSAVRHAGMPVLLINCDPSEASRATFANLAQNAPFDILESPTMKHGALLDQLFRQTNDEYLFLLDSDAELHTSAVVDRFRHAFDNPQTFGAGWTRGPNWLTPDLGGGDRTGYYQERPWMPVTMFRTAHIRDGLAAGHSFLAKPVYNDFFFSSRLSWLAAMRLQESFTPAHRRIRKAAERVAPLRALRNTRWNALAWCRDRYAGQRPNYVYYDTGADIYQHLRHDRELLFWGPSIEVEGNPEAVLVTDDISHLHGITRLFLDPTAAQGVDLDLSMLERLADHLRDHYDVDWVTISGRETAGLDEHQRLLRHATIVQSSERDGEITQRSETPLS